MRLLRLDVGSSSEICSSERTPEGYLRCWATIARTGVQTYQRHDGSRYVEYRPPEEVGRVDSLASVAGKAVTLEHPPVLLNTDNTSEYQVGFSDSEVIFDGKFVRVRMTVTDADAIASAERGDTLEVSAGYTVDLDETPGITPDGERFDAIQRNIEVNHIALTRRGRAGADVKVHLDSSTAIAVADSPAHSSKQLMAKITIGGADYEVSEAVAAAYTTDQRTTAADHQSKLDSLSAQAEAIKAERDQLQAQIDTLSGTTDELKSRVDALTDENQQLKARSDSADQLDARLDARLGLIQHASPILGADFTFKGLSDRAIHEAVIHKIHGDSLDLADRSDEYVMARFDAILDRSSSTGELREGIGAALRSDTQGDSRSQRKDAYRERLEKAWQQQSTDK